MKDKLFIIGKILGLLFFLAIFSFLGIASGNPVMIVAYAGFFIVVMGVIFFFVKRNQRHFEIISQANPLIGKIIGVALMLIAIASPIIAISSMQIFDIGTTAIGFGTIAIVLALTLALIAGCMFAVNLINKINSSKIHKMLGYLIVIVASAVPALMVMQHDHTTTGIGSVYYLALMVAVLFWWGFSLYQNKE
jgi:hypothetical protein